MRDSADDVFASSAAADREAVEARLATIVAEKASHHEGMAEAVGYSLLGGGKRLRALLCLWTHDALGGKERAAALDVACAVECLHTYSLVHDDLPSIGILHVFQRSPAKHTIPEGFYDFPSFHQRCNFDPVQGPTVFFADDRVLGHVPRA